MQSQNLPSSEHEQIGEATYINLSGYRFVALDYLPLLQADLLQALQATGVLGTILLAEEGINIALSGSANQVKAAKVVFDADPRLANIWLKESFSDQIPFSKLKVRIRHEIIAFDGPEAGVRQLHRPEAKSLAPETIANWLDEGKPLTLLDTRNQYEIQSGTFMNAKQLNIDHFRDFQKALHAAIDSGNLPLDTPIVTFCTGGIRCEKAAPWMIEQGFTEVYQIEGGIINYFEKTGGKHWQGDCFVFDDRVEVNKDLSPTGATWCKECQLTIPPGELCSCQSDLTAIEMV